jgi:hypothetical protein
VFSTMRAKTILTELANFASILFSGDRWKREKWIRFWSR